VAGKVTIGLASHWLCATDLEWFIQLRAHGLREGDGHPAQTPLRSMAPLCLCLFNVRTVIVSHCRSAAAHT